MYRSIVYCLLLCIVISGCTNRLEYREYFNYFNGFSNGSYVKQKVDSLTYQLQYRPSEFCSLLSYKGEDFSIDTVAVHVKDFEQFNTYSLRIGVPNEDILKYRLTSENQYYDRISLLSNDFSSMIKGVIGNDTLPCVFHHFERTYKISPFIQITFSLENHQKKLDEILFYDEIFQSGTLIKFPNLKEYQKKLPSLRL